MPITEEEKTKLEQLKTRRDELIGVTRIRQEQKQLAEPSFIGAGLQPRDQAKLQQLRRRRNEILGRSAELQQVPTELIGRLRGKTPAQITAPQPQRPSARPGFGIGPGIARRSATFFDKQRAEGLEALKKLKSQGFTDEQIINQIQISGLQDKQTQLTGRDLPRLIGGMAGGLAAMLTFGPDPTDIVVGPAVARLVTGLLSASGTFAGATAGELLGQKIAGEEIDLSRAAQAGGIDAAIDFSAGFLVNRLGKALAPFRSTIIPEAAGFADDFSRVGGRVLPAELTESGILDTVETIAETAPIGRGGVRKLKNVIIPKQFRKWTQLKFDEMAQGVTRLDSERIAPIIDDALRGEKGTFTLAKIQARKNYAAVDKIAKDAKIDLRPLKAWAKKQLDEAAEIGGRSLSPHGNQMLKQITDAQDFVGYERGFQLRSSFLGDLPALKLVQDKNIGLTKQAIRRVDDLLSSTGTKFGLSEEAEAMRRIADKFYKEQFGTGVTAGAKAGRFQKDAVKQIFKALEKEQPEKLIDIVFKKNASLRIKQVKSVIGDDAFLRLRATWLDNMVAKTTSGDGLLRANAFLHNLDILGESTLREIFPNPGHLEDVYKIGVGARILQKSTGGSAVAIERGQAVAAGVLASGVTRGSPRATATALGVLGVPKVLAGIIQSPRASRLMVDGIRIGIGTRQAASMIGRAAVIANEEQVRRQLRKSKKIFSRRQKQSK